MEILQRSLSAYATQTHRCLLVADISRKRVNDVRIAKMLRLRFQISDKINHFRDLKGIECLQIMHNLLLNLRGHRKFPLFSNSIQQGFS